MKVLRSGTPAVTHASPHRVSSALTLLSVVAASICIYTAAGLPRPQVRFEAQRDENIRRKGCLPTQVVRRRFGMRRAWRRARSWTLRQDGGRRRSRCCCRQCA